MKVIKQTAKAKTKNSLVSGYQQEKNRVGRKESYLKAWTLLTWVNGETI